MSSVKSRAFIGNMKDSTKPLSVSKTESKGQIAAKALGSQGQVDVMHPVKQAKNKRENVRSWPPPVFELRTSSEQVFCILKIDGENQYCNR
jgi:hypothetical protein